MEMHFFNGHGMNCGFNFSQHLKGSNGALFHALGKRRTADDFDYRGQGAMRRMSVRGM